LTFCIWNNNREMIYYISNLSSQSCMPEKCFISVSDWNENIWTLKSEFHRLQRKLNCWWIILRIYCFHRRVEFCGVIVATVPHCEKHSTFPRRTVECPLQRQEPIYSNHVYIKLYFPSNASKCSKYQTLCASNSVSSLLYTLTSWWGHIYLKCLLN